MGGRAEAGGPVDSSLRVRPAPALTRVKPVAGAGAGLRWGPARGPLPMPVPTRPALFFLPALLLAACAGAPAPADTGLPEPLAPPPIEETAMACDHDAAQWAVGRPFDEAMRTRLRADTGAASVREVRPGMAVTMDFREDRLTVELDAAGNVVSLRCG